MPETPPFLTFWRESPDFPSLSGDGARKEEMSGVAAGRPEQERREEARAPEKEGQGARTPVLSRMISSAPRAMR